MSTEDTQQQNRFGRIEESNESVSREELNIRLQIKELSLVRLRQRVTELERKHGHDPDGHTDEIAEKENRLLEELDAIRGRSDE